MAMRERIDRDAVLAGVNIVDVIGGYLDLKKSGVEHECPCPFHREKTPSFKVNEKKQLAQCFGCGWSGDAIRFVTDYEDIGFIEAVRVLTGGELRQVSGAQGAQRASVRPERVDDRPEWEPIIPTPADVPEPSFIFRKPINGVWTEFPMQAVYRYISLGGEPIGYVVRLVNPETGKKEPMPLVWARDINPNSDKHGTEQWAWKSFPKPRPLYNLPDLASMPGNLPVLLVEGEKCVDVGAPVVKSIPVLSWPGGGKAIQHADWSYLEGRNVIVWRDADQAGYQSTYGWYGRDGELNKGLAHLLQEAGVASVKFVEPPSGVPDGWDIADAIQEDGWDRVQVIAYIKSHAGPALPPLEFVDPRGSQEQAPTEETPAGEVPEDDAAPDYYHSEEAPDDYEDDPYQEEEPYRPLGYDKGMYYYLSHGSKQVHEMSTGGHSKQALLSLAPLSHWESRYPGATSRVSWDMAINALMRACESEGIYDPSRIRGRGAWWDDGRAVLHLGSHLVVDGEAKDLREVKGWHIYEHASTLPVDIDNPLTPKEAYKLLEICKGMQWEKPIEAYLLGGFIMLAPICGALDWRPHIYITGGGGSGKTWCMHNVVSRCLSGFALNALASTSEAGIRQALGHDARPVVFDEAEGEDAAAQQRMQMIMALMRQASSETGGEILKGSAGGKHQSYRIRSMFAFSSIGVSVHQYSDKTRVSVLNLRVDQNKSQDEREAEFEVLKRMTFETLTDEYIQRLHARAIRLIGVIRQNARVFAVAGARVIGQQRLGDQIGALLAGAYALHSNGVVTLEEAQRWIEGQNWEDEAGLTEQRDEYALIARLMVAQVKVAATHGGNLDRTIGELVENAAALKADPEVLVATAQEALMRYGMKLSDDRKSVVISNQHSAIARILRDTPWPNNWGKIIKRLPGASASSKTEYFGVGANSRAVIVPITSLIS